MRLSTVLKRSLLFFVMFLIGAAMAKSAFEDFELVIQDGHSRPVLWVAASPDGKLIASSSGCGDNEIKLWSSQGILIRNIVTTNAVNAILFSPDGKSILAAGQGITRWSLAGGLLESWEMTNSYRTLRLSPDGTWLVAGTYTGKLLILPLRGGSPRLWTAHESAILGLDISPRGDQIITGSYDGIVKLWSPNGSLIKERAPLNVPVYAVAFSPLADALAIGTSNALVRLEDLEFKNLDTFSEAKGEIKALLFSPSGNKLAATTSSGNIYIWKVKGGKPLVVPANSAVSETTWRYIFTGEDFFFNGNKINIYPGTDGVYGLCPSGDKTIFISGGGDRAVKIWNWDGELAQRLISICQPPGGMSVSSQGIISVSKVTAKEETDLWDPKGRLLRSLNGIHYRSRFSPDGSLMTSFNDSGLLRMIDLNGTETAKISLREKGRAFQPIFSPDGNKVAVATEKSIVLLDTNLTVLQEIADPIIPRFTFGVVFPDATNTDGAPIQGLYNLPLKRMIPGGTAEKIGMKPGDRIKSLDGNAFPSATAFRIFAAYQKPGTLLEIIYDRDGKEIKSRFTVANPYVAPPFGTFNTRQIKFFSRGERMLRLDNWSGLSRLMDGNGRPLGNLDPGIFSFGSLACLPDLDFWASTSSEGINLWNRNGERLREIPGSSSIGQYQKIALAPDGERVTQFFGSGLIRTFLTNGSAPTNFQGFPIGLMYDCSYSPDARLLLSCGTKMPLQMMRADNGEHVALLSEGGEWIVYSPDGYFDGSPGGGRLLAVAQGNNGFPIDQFALKFNRPDIVLGRMGMISTELSNHYVAQYFKRLRKFGFTNAAGEADESFLGADFHTPEVQIRTTSVDGKFARVEWECADETASLRSDNIFVNDVPLFGALGRPLGGRKQIRSDQVELTSGRNKIEVSCINAFGVESRRALTTAEWSGTAEQDLYFIGFGVSLYADPALTLKYAAKDAVDLENVFKRMKRITYREVKSRVYTDADVTRQNIAAAKQFLMDAKPDDTFVLFIAGHGMHDSSKEATYYYLTHKADPARLAETCVNFEEIEALLQGVAPRNKLFLMDTCESGEVKEGVEGTMVVAAGSRGISARAVRGLKISPTANAGTRTYLFQKDRYIYNDLNRRSGAIVFSSSKGGEFSYEDDKLQNGLFTSTLIRSLTTTQADRNRDGKVTTDELRDFVSLSVATASGNLQHPTVDRDNLYQRFAFPVNE